MIIAAFHGAPFTQIFRTKKAAAVQLPLSCFIMVEFIEKLV